MPQTAHATVWSPSAPHRPTWRDEARAHRDLADGYRDRAAACIANAALTAPSPARQVETGFVVQFWLSAGRAAQRHAVHHAAEARDLELQHSPSDPPAD